MSLQLAAGRGPHTYLAFNLMPGPGLGYLWLLFNLTSGPGLFYFTRIQIACSNIFLSLWASLFLPVPTLETHLAGKKVLLGPRWVVGTRWAAVPVWLGPAPATERQTADRERPP